MEKAYDLKNLASRLTARGLEVAEDAAIIILEETCDWSQESAVLSKTPLDDILAVAAPLIKKEAMKYADKIDGVEDQA
jgi:hypothetical protein